MARAGPALRDLTVTGAGWVGLLTAVTVALWPSRSVWRSPSVGSGPRPILTQAAVGRQGRGARRRRAAQVAAVLAVLDALAAALRAGLSAETALRHVAASDRSAAGRLAAALADAGSRADRCWSRYARETGAPEVLVVAQAWALSRRAGVRLADAVDLAAGLLRDAQARGHRREVALAGPRATIAVLTLLPLLGPAAGLALGIAPSTLYAGSTPSLLATAAGLVLLLIGRGWARGLVARSLRATPASVSGPGRRSLRVRRAWPGHAGASAREGSWPRSPP